MYQIIIVGAGPAGAYLAYLLSQKGLSVLLLEKERLPHSKTCGGAISPRVINLMQFDLSSVIEDFIHTAVFTHQLKRPVAIKTEKPIVYMIKRERFDVFLIDRAKETGAIVQEDVRVDRVRVTDNAVYVHSGERQWQGKILVGADGAFSSVARSLELARPSKYVRTLVSEKPLNPESLSLYRGLIKVDYGLVPAGYAWVFPKADHLSLGVGTLSPRIKNLHLYLDEVLKAEGITPGPEVRGWTIPLNTKPERLHYGRALLVGDAAGLANAFTGEGIYAAIFSAYLAADVIAAQISAPKPDLQSYTRLIQEKLGSELADAIRLTRWFYPVTGLVHHILQRQQKLALDLIQFLAGNINNAQLCSSFRCVLGMSLPK